MREFIMNKIKWLFNVCLVMILLSCGNIKANTASIAPNGLEYVENDNGTVSITGYYGTEDTVTIPSEINGKHVQFIGKLENNIMKHVVVEEGIDYWGSEVFENCKELESVILPNDITILTGRSFANCTNLTSINIPDSVEEICGGVFNGCSKLSNVKLPEGLKKLGTSSFAGTAISKIDIPSSVTTIINNPFIGCSNLLEINVNSENSEFASVNGILYNKDLTKLLIYPSGKDNSEILESITSMEPYAFYGCSKLTSIPRMENIKILPQYSFSECNNLTSISIPESIIKIEEYAFYDCSALQEVVVENGTTAIENNAFGYCENLKKIVIPNNVNKIGDNCFGAYNDNRFNITIYANLDSYARIYANEHNMKFSCIKHNNIVTDNEIPVTCTQDGKKSGCHCADCGTIISGCEVIPKGHKIVHIYNPPTCTKNGEKRTYCEVCNEPIDENGSNVMVMVYPALGHKFDAGIIKTEKKIYTCTVCGQIRIVKITAPKKGKVVSDSSKLYIITKSSITNDSVEFIASKTSKSSITIPNTVKIDGITYKVTSIAKNAFKNNTKVNKITIGSNIMKINAGAFSGCKNLKKITIKSQKIKSVGKNAFKGIKASAKIKVPSNKLKKYRKLFDKKGQKSTVHITR